MYRTYNHTYFCVQNHALLLDFLCFGRRSGSRCPFLFEKTMVERINLRGLGTTEIDDTCTTGAPASQSILYKFFGSDYENAVQTITERLNWNIGAQCYPLIVGSGCYDQSEVGCIVNVYYNLAKTSAIPEYDRKNNAKSIELIEKTVALRSGRQEGRVKAVLYHLYFATMDNSIKTNSILFPIQAKNNQEVKERPKEITSTQTQIENAAAGLGEIGTYLLIGGVVLAGLYALTLLKK